MIVRDRDFIDRFLERRLNLYTLAVPETVFASRAADRDQPIGGELPKDSILIGRRPPFTNDLAGSTAASSEKQQQNCAD